MEALKRVGQHIMMSPDSTSLQNNYFKVILRKPRTDYPTLLVQDFFVEHVQLNVGIAHDDLNGSKFSQWFKQLTCTIVPYLPFDM